jgi:hypothetical protein
MDRRFFAIGVAALSLVTLGACDTTTSWRAYDAPESPRQSVSYSTSGTVSEIDRSSSVLTLQGDGATSKLPFEAAAFREIKEGDLVTAHLTLTRNGLEPHRRAFDAPELPPDGAFPPVEEPLGHFDVSGKITEIDYDKGQIGLHVGASNLMLNFPAAAVREFSEGDDVVLRVGFTRGA